MADDDSSVSSVQSVSLMEYASSDPNHSPMKGMMHFGNEESISDLCINVTPSFAECKDNGYYETENSECEYAPSDCTLRADSREQSTSLDSYCENPGINEGWLSKQELDSAEYFVDDSEELPPCPQLHIAFVDNAKGLSSNSLALQQRKKYW
eukprot:CAMPEP_0185036476 /NCGR_PEP_ID=MMETSP1103-20130426/29543_1 /TAXON_ID=36769 /ORGANISM="Paraphysomonas bandaiensis, Strain Caron Lab Isolate" /LENGTH=151 /DNA_ID=CAMNT_0027574023 /DNA_START=93 /DNA_END=545 /DNA_ORIENTATION=-